MGGRPAPACLRARRPRRVPTTRRHPRCALLRRSSPPPAALPPARAARRVKNVPCPTCPSPREGGARTRRCETWCARTPPRRGTLCAALLRYARASARRPPSRPLRVSFASFERAARSRWWSAFVPRRPFTPARAPHPPALRRFPRMGCRFWHGVGGRTRHRARACRRTSCFRLF